MRHRCHPTKSPLLQYIQAYKPFADHVPPNIKQYHKVPLITHHLMSHAQYTWSSLDLCSHSLNRNVQKQCPDHVLACELLNQTGDKVPVLITDMCTSGLSTLCFSQRIEPPDADNNFTRQELDPGVKVATTRVGLLYKGSSPHSTILTLGKWSSAIGSHNPLLGRVNPLGTSR